MFRVTAVAFDPLARTWRSPTAVVGLPSDQPVVIGREGEVPIALDPNDPGVSRRALRVTAGVVGWTIDVLNTNHAWLHPWGQRPAGIKAGRTVERRWPRIGVLLVGGREDVQHWVLLESDHRATDPRPVTPISVGETVRADPPTVLTSAQLEAIRAVFRQHLSWPPVVGATPELLSAAARRLGVSPAAVTQRLEQARARVHAFGPHRQVGVTDPEYVYLLAAAGYLPFPPRFRPERP